MDITAHDLQGDYNHIITGVPASFIDEAWPVVADLLEKALKHDYYGMSLADVKEFIVNEEMQLWTVFDEAKHLLAACTTETNEAFGHKGCKIILLAGGHMSTWLDDLLDVIDRWATAQGCEYIEAIGRRGWEKAAKKFGYQYGHTVIYKELGHG